MLTPGVAAAAMAAATWLPAAALGGTWSATVQLFPAQGAPVAPGSQVPFEGLVERRGDATTCAVKIGDREVTDRCDVSPEGAITGSFTVPDDTQTGPTLVSVCWNGCWDNVSDPDGTPDYWQADAVLAVATAPDLVQVPDVVCLTYDEANRALKEGRLNGVDLSDGAPGYVVAQQPPSGSEAEAGSTVSLTVGALTVPDLTGLTYSAAKAALSRCLELRATGSTEGTVVVQAPGAETPAEPGDVVLVTLSGPSTPTESTATTTTPTTTSSNGSTSGGVDPPPRQLAWGGVGVAALAGGAVVWLYRRGQHNQPRPPAHHVLVERRQGLPRQHVSYPDGLGQSHIFRVAPTRLTPTRQLRGQ